VIDRLAGLRNVGLGIFVAPCSLVGGVISRSYARPSCARALRAPALLAGRQALGHGNCGDLVETGRLTPRGRLIPRPGVR
jgi:hypothetical protein